MSDSKFWAQVAADRDSIVPRKPPYSQADIVQALAEMRAIVRLAAERIKKQRLGPMDDQLLKKMREVYREARMIGKQFEVLPVSTKKR